MEGGNITVASKSPDDLHEADDSEDDLKIAARPGDPLFSRDRSAGGKDGKAVDEAVGKHIQAIRYKSHRFRNEPRQEFEDKKEKIDTQDLPQYLYFSCTIVRHGLTIGRGRLDERCAELQLN